jgi:hypoxanthine phosphoribosyltransferase
MGHIMSKKLWYQWDEMRRDVNTLCRDIVLDKFDPDCIVGLSRGGLTPGVMMSHWLQKPFKPVKAALRDFPEWEDYLPRKTESQMSSTIRIRSSVFLGR